MVMTFIVIMNNLALIVRGAEFVLIFTVCVCLNFMRLCAFVYGILSVIKSTHTFRLFIRINNALRIFEIL